MSAYIKMLQEETRRAAAESKTLTPHDRLRERFLAWHRSLPDVSRDRPFAMSEIEAAMGTQGRYISSILLELGWRRKRRWNTTGHYHRYWVPLHHIGMRNDFL